MKLLPLYKMQKQLREHINYNGEDRAKCLMMAFWVELGECANEWKGFKMWSKKRWQPNTRSLRPELCDCKDCDEYNCDKEHAYGEWHGDNYVIYEHYYYNPLLEEYIDGFHFLLELGLEFNHRPEELWAFIPNTAIPNWTVLEQFDAVIEAFFRFKHDPNQFFLYEQLVQLYLGLGQLLGFTERQIYDAYLTKNAINHERQNEGY